MEAKRYVDIIYDSCLNIHIPKFRHHSVGISLFGL